MKVVKPCGNSVVLAGGEIRRTIQPSITSITSVNAKQTHRPAIDFLLNNEKFFLAQWASMLDKIISKPHQANQASPNYATYEARENLSKAFYVLWKDKKLLNNFSHKDNQRKSFNQQWGLKVHPYKKPNKPTANNKPEAIKKAGEISKGRWYDSLVTKSKPNKNTAKHHKSATIHYKNTAKIIYEHLYVKQRSISKRSAYPQGYIANRANSIEKSVHSFTLKDNKLATLCINDQHRINRLTKQSISIAQPSKYRLDGLIKDLKIKTKQYYQNKVSAAELRAKKTKHPVKPPLENQQLPLKEAMICLYEHYARIFGTVTKIETIIIKEPELWQYHCLIKSTLKQRYPKQAVFNKIYPVITEDQLHKLAQNIETNKTLAMAIRLGKVVHYSQDNLGYEDIEHSDIVNSDYWGSAGQTLIKQKESFAQHWLIALSVANGSLRGLLDTQDNADIYLSRGINTALEGIPTDFEARFKLLFGNHHQLYQDDLQRDELLRQLYGTLSQLRHASFHFKSEQSFNQVLLKKVTLDTTLDNNTSVSQTLAKNINNYIDEHLAQQQALVKKTLEASFVTKYLNQTQCDQLLSSLQNNQAIATLLPKFNKLLHRAATTEQSIIAVANQVELQNNPNQQCAFICLKQLYEQDFWRWLLKQKSSTLNHHIDQAKIRANKQANKLNAKNTLEHQKIMARMQQLRGINAQESLLAYFSYLSAQTASFFQIQTNTYQHNAQAASEHSNFIEQLKQDFLIRAFKQYLKAEKFNYLLHLGTPASCVIDIDKITKKTPVNNPLLYLSLHLIPIEFVNQLSLQIKKYTVLTGSEKFGNIHNDINLYLTMHNAILDIKWLDNRDELAKFYDNKALFEQVFSQDNKHLISVKGLREMLRFGNLSELGVIFERSIVEANEINSLQDKQKNIAAIQAKKAKAHQKLSQQKDINKQDKADYKSDVDKVSEYNHLKNQVYLHNHKQTHQLIMTISGRLVGFSRRYERDIYFVLLALLTLNKVKTDELSQNFLASIRSGQIIKASNQLGEQYANIKSKLNLLFQIEKHREIRNRFAHFDDLRKAESLNITQQINEARQLMSYDRKSKNSVVKSILNIVKKDNISIDFTMDNQHNLTLKSIKADSIIHLKDKDISEKPQGKKYKNAVKKLFENTV